jgi:hypothetical protein
MPLRRSRADRAGTAPQTVALPATVFYGGGFLDAQAKKPAVLRAQQVFWSSAKCIRRMMYSSKTQTSWIILQRR